MGRPLLIEGEAGVGTVPELGTIAAAEPPAVVITSNRTRELHDALKRRCLYHWISFPDLGREVEIVRLRCPDVSEALARSVAVAVARLRDLDLVKRPGIAEAIDWARALSLVGAESADGSAARETLAGWSRATRTSAAWRRPCPSSPVTDSLALLMLFDRTLRDERRHLPHSCS